MAGAWRFCAGCAKKRARGKNLSLDLFVSEIPLHRDFREIVIVQIVNLKKSMCLLVFPSCTVGKIFRTKPETQEE